MSDNDNEEKKIIVDEDWKEQALKEKEILAAQEKAERQKKTQTEQPAQLPPADFAGLTSLLTTQAFFAMGIIRAEKDDERPPDLKLAKYNIDMLEVIQQKTQGNLTDDETKLLENTLHQLRMAFVKVSEKSP